MKKKHLLGLLLMAMAIGVGFVSCEKDDGSEGIEFRMRNYSNGGDGIWLLNSVALEISSSNNFYLYNELYNIGEISCVGSVSSLGRIKKIPESGWVREISVNPEKGYIIRCKVNGIYNYARVYVEDWIEGTNGGIIGAVIRYQDNWKIEE